MTQEEREYPGRIIRVDWLKLEVEIVCYDGERCVVPVYDADVRRRQDQEYIPVRWGDHVDVVLGKTTYRGHVIPHSDLKRVHTTIDGTTIDEILHHGQPVTVYPSGGVIPLDNTEAVVRFEDGEYWQLNTVKHRDEIRVVPSPLAQKAFDAVNVTPR